MNIKWKAISAVMALITIICVIYIFFYLEHESRDMDESISIYSRSVSSLVEFIDRRNRTQFKSRIKSFVNYRISPAREKLIMAFRNRNRAELLAASLPFLQTIKEESPYFSSIAWILPDNTVFLRVHNPSLYGDNVGDMRPDIAEVNRLHKQVSGFAVGIFGMQFRVVQPVFYNDEYLGAVQFGIDARELLDTVRQELGLASGLLINNERYMYVERPVLPAATSDACTIQSEEIDLFRPVVKKICHSKEPQAYNVDGRRYIIKKILGLPDYWGEDIGALIVALDITEFYESVRKTVIWTVLIAVSVLLLSFLILNISFEKILKRIVELNRSLAAEKENLSRRVEERTRELEKKAAEYKLVAHAVENSIDAFVFTDLHGNITYPNRAACQLFGYEPQELTGRHVDILSADSGLSTEKVIDDLKNDGRWSGNVVAAKRSGEKFECMLFCSMIHDTSGEPVGMLGILRDLSEIRKVEEEKAVVEAQLHQAMKLESIGRLAGGVAHDFNNILNVINGYAELCLIETSPEQPIHQKIASILEAGQRAAQLTQQLLAFSRRQIISREPLNINDLLAELNMMMGRILGEDIELVLKTDPDLWHVMADRSQLEQVVMNLAVNARDAMPEGGTFTIQTCNLALKQGEAGDYDVEPGNYVSILISDSGQGIHQDIIDKIFEPFFTTKEQGKGTGLGLATVYGIVRQNSGTIAVFSQPGTGTTFRILLPRTEEASVHIEESWKDMSSLRGGTETILLAEDDAEVRELTGKVLTDMGYSAIMAKDGVEALEIFENYHDKIDLLITDVVMPSMKGPELAQRLLEKDPSLKILLISGYTEDAVFKEGVAGEKMVLLHKPVSIRKLTETIRNILDGTT